MDYERRGVRWYWVTLFVIYSVGTIYAILSGNPFLYSHKEFKREIQAAPDRGTEPVPSVATQLPLAEKTGKEQSYFTRLNQQRNADGPSDLTFGKNFVEKEAFPLNVSDSDFRPAIWSMDQDGVVLGGNGEAAAFALTGEKRWEFHFLSGNDKPLSSVLTNSELAYLVASNGEIVAISRKTGQLQWNLKLHENVVGPGLVAGGRLLIPVMAPLSEGKNPKPTFRWVVIQNGNGEIDHYSKPVEGKPDFQISMAPELEAWILSYDNKIVAIDPEKLEALWTQTLADPIRGPVTVVDHYLFASTTAGKVIKLDGSKKGKIEWEADVERPPVSAPTYLPIMSKLSVIDDQGGLQLIDGKAGKALWHFNIENHNTLKDTWALRLRGSVIQETGMDWLHRGWTVWAPCAKNRFCIYNPAKGQLISRISLSGSLISFPMIKDKDLYFLVSQGTHWTLSHIEGLKTAAETPKPPETH